MSLRTFFAWIVLAGFALPPSLFGSQPDLKPPAPSAAKLQIRDQWLKAALALKAEAKWDAALHKLQDVLDLEKEVLGPVHADVARTYEQMAAVEDQRADFAAASKARAQVLAAKESKTEAGWKRRRAGELHNWKRLRCLCAVRRLAISRPANADLRGRKTQTHTQVTRTGPMVFEPSRPVRVL